MTSAGRGLRALGRQRMMEIILVVICIWLSFKAPNFLTYENLLNVLRSVSMQGLIAFGMTLVIIVGEIDLSVGAMAAFSGCLLAYLAERKLPIGLGFGITAAVGYLTGLFTGVMRAKWAVPSFITTLALFTGLKGGALMVTNGFPIASFPQSFYFLGGGYVSVVPVQAIVLLGSFAAFHVLMTRTAFGRAVYATGGNTEAARLSGINVGRVRMQVLALVALLASVAGMMLAARIMSGTPTVAQGWELDIIAAVIIGGTSLSGGVGTVWGTLVGIVFIGVIINGMTLMDTPVYTQYVVRGLLIFAAVLLNKVQKSKE